MRIGIVSTFNTECGISTYTEHLVENYPKDTIVFSNRLGSLSDTHSSQRPNIRCWERTGNFKELTKMILDSRVSLVHFQHEYGLFQDNQAFLSMLKELKQHKIKTVITYHTVFTDSHNEMDKRLMMLTPWLDKIIVHQRGAKDILNTDKCVVIYHGTCSVTAKTKEESRKYLSIPDDKFVCMYLGFISPNKGIIESAQAVLSLREKFPNIYLVVAGMPVIHGCNYSNLEYCVNIFRGIKRMNGFDHVKIIPSFIPEKDFDYYAGAADIFIENHGQTQFSISGMSHLIMGYGKPSVSSTACILDDMNYDRSVKFNLGDISGMANAITELIKNPGRREQISKNALKFAEETSWEKITKKHLELYKSL